jgi:Flp pilus assembly protein TadB
MLLFLFYFFLAYMAYQLIFKFILPIYRTTKQVRRSFRDMQEGMNGQSANSSNRQTKPKGKPAEDYIDFEEVKDK